MKKITVIGGDKRLKTAVKELTLKGFKVNTIGLFDGEDGNINGDVLLLPVPTTKDAKPFSHLLQNAKYIFLR